MRHLANGLARTPQIRTPRPLALREWVTDIVNWIRRAILELTALTVIAVGVGFLGPFGTYSQSAIADRTGHWGVLLMGAYLLVRPSIWASRRIALVTRLPRDALTVFAVILASLPLAMLWRRIGQHAYRLLDGYSGLLPFTLLCALGVLAVTIWAERTDARLLARQTAHGNISPSDEPMVAERADAAQGAGVDHIVLPAEPALRARLSPGFRPPIIALQSEDHYVRVHGERGSELLLMRLRDAIAEMGEVQGEQVHRSWWIARCGVVRAERQGRNWVVRMTNGKTALVARQSIDRLGRLGLQTRDTASCNRH
jgi:hypothetical protein